MVTARDVVFPGCEAGGATSFPDTIAFVLGKEELPFKICTLWGFVWPNDVADIHRTDNGVNASVKVQREVISEC